MGGGAVVSSGLLRLHRRRHIAGQGDAIDQHQCVDILAGGIGIGLALHRAMLGDEVVVAADHQEIIVGCRGVADRQQRQALPFLIEVLGILRLAVMQAEAVELGIVIDVDESAYLAGVDGEIVSDRHRLGAAGNRRAVGRPVR